MSNNKERHCLKCKTISNETSRYCEYHTTHRSCTKCKLEKHISEFNKTIKESDGNLGRCKSCEDLVTNYKKCFTCKKLKHKSKFVKTTDISCKNCHDLSNQKQRRKCKKCHITKDKSEFAYTMKTCKTCTTEKPTIKKVIGQIHCKYCNEISDNNSQICNKCRNTKKCHRCKERKLKIDFFSDYICNECHSKEHKIYELEHSCTKCNSKIIIKRNTNKLLKNFICDNCIKKQKEYYDSLPGDYIKCKLCDRSFMFISSSHIIACSKNTLTYQQYKDKYGADSVWSTKYKHLQSINSKEAINRPEIKQKISDSINRYIKNNKEIVKKRTEQMRNSPNRLKNLLEHYKNMPEEEKQLRSESAAKSWECESTRERRIIGLQSDKAKAARSRNIKICQATEQQIISKPARKLFEFLKDKGYNVVLEHGCDFYHIDIAIVEKQIAIEVDGDYWHGNKELYEEPSLIQINRQNNDKRKNTYLTNRGWKILRFWQTDLECKDGYEKVLENLNKIMGVETCQH
jgi:very-short-patch-repair endonuclease